MKKLILTIAVALVAGSTFAQTDAEKAAAKAAKDAQKTAEKEANNHLSNGMKLRDEVTALYTANLTEQKEKGDKANQQLIAKNQADIKTKSNAALDELFAADKSGLVSPKKYYDMYKAMDDVSSQLLNPELSLAAKHETFDTVTFAKSIDGACAGAYGIMQYGKPNDELQKLPVQQAKLKMPKLNTYYAYLCIFYTETKNLDGACAALDKYKEFPTKYPLVANEESVKNPQYPSSQFGFNIYLTAFNMKRFDICDKYYQLASEYNDPQSQDFVVSSRPQIALLKGDTVQWIKELKTMALDQSNESNAETATQNLLAYYSKQGPKQMGQFADEMLAENPESKIANYGKGYSLYAQGKYSEALPYYQKTVEIDPEYMEGNYQCGNCYYNIGKDNYQGIANKKYTTQSLADKDSEVKVKQYFRKALPYFEKVRELKPDDPSRWAGELKIIYSNLGMKQKAAELPTDY